MMEKITIEIPQGHEIDLEKSDLTTGQIVFKKIERKKPLRFEDLEDIEGYYIDSYSDINRLNITFGEKDKNVFPERDQCEAVLALSQLLQLHKAWKEFDTEPTNRIFWISPIGLTAPYVRQVIRTGCHGILNFNSESLTQEFASTFKDLILKLKPISLL